MIRQSKKIKSYYDKRFDILYIFNDEPVPAESEPVVKGIYLRRSIPDEAIVGATIEDYSKREKSMLAAVLPDVIKAEAVK